ncbi:MAG: energy-coupling factor transporter transmembrane protein EcfT [Chloroflexi bacterium]|nr:energy-coupling factor transporter transmembrane protein EcfT [Chloroflexota bacterium]
MSEFELLRSVTLGQYLPTGSFLHRVDPRAKLAMGILLVVGAIATSSLTGLTFVLTIVVVGFIVAHIPLGYGLSGIKPMWPFLVLLALLQVVAIPQNDVNTVVLAQWWFITLTVRDLIAAALLFLRFTVMVWGLSLLSFTTTTTELTHGTEHLLRPLQRLGLPTHEFALMVNIALRFVPLLAEETERLMKAQASRGADFGGGRQLNFIQRTRKLIPLLVPLFLSSLQRAEDLILAMEARCYTGGRGRTHLIHLHASCVDYLVLFLIFAVLAVAIATGIFSADLVAWRILQNLM